MTYEEAENKLYEFVSDGENLDGVVPFIVFFKGDEKANLHGRFTADELEAIVVFMRGKK